MMSALIAAQAGGVILSAGENLETEATAHHLYLGLDLSLQREDQLNRVVDADHAAVWILRDGRRVRLPLRHARDFKTAVVAKVGRDPIEILELEADRAYSRATDPQARAAAQQMLLLSVQEASQEQAEIRMMVAQSNADAINAALGQATAAAAKAGLPVQAVGPSAEQQQALAGAQSAFGLSTMSAPYNSAVPGTGLLADEGDFDAFSVSFTIAAAKPVADPYGVLRLFLRRPENPQEQVTAIRFFSLPKLGSKPTRVNLLHEGLPRGFTVDRYELHVYEGARELVTNLSPNRVALSRDEVHQFFMLQYMTEHREQDAPVEIVTGLLDHDLADHVTAEQRQRAVDVAVDVNGMATAVQLDPAQSSAADAYITSVLREVRFLPALRAGKPVAGKGRFVLSEFLAP